MKNNRYILYGSPVSNFTGKARSYLIKNHLPYREVTATSKHYAKQVLPRIGERTIPILETSDGTVIRDSTAIIDYFESQTDSSSTPEGPRQRIVSYLLDIIGPEGLWRPLMHYRWSFPDENQTFLDWHFQTLIPEGRDKAMLAAGNMERMREFAMMVGVAPGNVDLIETLYETLIALLNRHFSQYPYFLGHRPSLGDYGMIAPFYAHLGRDPKPLALMQAKAVCLFRWVERMNRPEPDCGEFGVTDENFIPNDVIPETLKAVLHHMAIDFVPETRAAAQCINAWLEAQNELPALTPIQRTVGYAEFEVHGRIIKAVAQPYRFYLLQRLQTAYDAMTADDQKIVRDLLEECQLLPILTARLDRAIGRHNNQEVWL